MVEKCITIYEDNQIIALFIVNEIDLGYLDKKIVAYVKKEHVNLVIHTLDLFKDTQINIKELVEKLNISFQDDTNNTVKLITTAFELISDNNNKTSRNKRMLEQEGLKNYVKVVKHVGIKKTKYIRKR